MPGVEQAADGKRTGRAKGKYVTKTIRAIAPACLFVLLAPPAAAQSADPVPEDEPSRVINLIVYGEDACPEAENPDEIVVCGRRPESDRYRIPKDLRAGEEEIPAPAQSWTAQMEALDQDMRVTRPGSCSAVGSYGQTGCFQQRLEAWQAQRRAQD